MMSQSSYRYTQVLVVAGSVLFLSPTILVAIASDAEDHDGEGLIDMVESEVQPPSEDWLRTAAEEPGVSLWNEEQAEAEIGSYVPDPGWHRHLAEKYNVSLEQAAEIGAWESTTMLQTTDALHYEFGDAIIRYSVDPAGFTINVATSLSEHDVRAFVDGLEIGRTQIDVLAGQVPASTVRGEIDRLTKALIAAGIPSTGAVEPNGMTIYVLDVAGAERVIDSVGVLQPLEVQLVEYHEVIDQTHIVPRGGWLDRKTYGTPSYGCTLGFAATLDDGTAGMVSAGHCPETTGTRRLGSAPDYVTSSTCLTLRRELQYYNDDSHPEVDAQFLRDIPGTSGNCLGSFIDDVCSSAYLDEGAHFDYWRCNAYADITDWSWTNPENGDVIFFGAFGTSGVQYGEIEENEYPACIPQYPGHQCPAVYVLVNYTSNTTGGDSGGAVRIGSTLQGVQKGALDWDFSRGVYSKVGYISDYYGMEPAISGPVGPNGT